MSDGRDGGAEEGGSEEAGGRHPQPGSEGDQGPAGDRGQPACEYQRVSGVRGQGSASNSSSSSSSGGEAEGRLPSRHGLCPGVRLHALRPLRGHQELGVPSDPGSGQRLHDDAAEGRGLPASQQHHAQGEFQALGVVHQVVGQSGPTA